MAPIELSGKPICITGASSGIGRATAIACARAGMPVALAARRHDRIENLARQIAMNGGRAVAVRTDVALPEDCERLVEVTATMFGSVYAVFANAGVGLDAPMHTLSDRALRELFEVNFFGTMNTIRAALPHLLEAKAGHVLICSSAIGKVGVPFFGAYCATKGAQSLVGRAMRHELRPLGVHVSTVHPVLTATEFAEMATARAKEEGSTVRGRMKRRFVQPPERVAHAVVACLRQPRTEVWTSAPSRWAFGLMTAFPSLADVAMERFASGARGSDAPAPRPRE